jgi:hypothetical protein
MGMTLRYEGREYHGGTAAEIVRALARDSAADGGEVRVREFVESALGRLADRVHLRELAPGKHLSEEAVAFNFLCLLDEYGIGSFSASASDSRAS